LKEVDFANNQIDEIHPKTFNGLNDLEIIDFIDNIIKEIHENTFNKY
jgi:Leucine-rich repeat (LRR) protein